MQYRYLYEMPQDGDYIVYGTIVGYRWVEVSRWLIPGTEMED
jgi:hypothetical protein